MKILISVSLTITLMCFTAMSADAVFDRETLFGADVNIENPTQAQTQATAVQPEKPYLSALGDRSLDEALTQVGAGSSTASVADGILLYPIIGSEKIIAVGYDAESKTMVLKLKDTGEVKSYLDVPEALYTNFVNSTIKDSFFTLAIDGRYTEGSSTSSVKGSEGEKITVIMIH